MAIPNREATWLTDKNVSLRRRRRRTALQRSEAQRKPGRRKQAREYLAGVDLLSAHLTALATRRGPGHGGVCPAGWAALCVCPGYHNIGRARSEEHLPVHRERSRNSLSDQRSSAGSEAV